MLERIIAFLRGTAGEQPLPEPDAAHLLGALMVRVAQADGVVRIEELQVIDRILARHCNIGPVDAARMRADCERLAEALPATGLLGPALVTRIPAADRSALVADLRAVAEADGQQDGRELALIDEVAALLGV